MLDHAELMRRCFQLAANGTGAVAPNPMVGAVLLSHGQVLAEGWHHAVGGPHAEVECLRAFGPGPVPPEAVMYVNLEPCSHVGRTPPCIDLLIERGVKRLVIGCGDPNPLVHGRGIARAREAGIEVHLGVLQEESRWLNRRFITSFERARPYIILKWARSSDGYLDDNGRTARISSPGTDVLVHRWRSEEQAILAGSRTVLADDPALTVRHVPGRDPLRVILDRGNVVPASAKVFDGSAPTLLITSTQRDGIRARQRIVDHDEDPVDAVLDELQEGQVRSLLVEGGAELLGHLIRRGSWDEARVITGTAAFGAGTPAPVLTAPIARTIMSGPDRIDLHTNGIVTDSTWHW